MFIVNVKRIVRAGFLNFTRNGFVTLSAVLVTTVTLFTMGSVVLLVTGLNASLQQIKNKVDINVYFTTASAQEDILALKKTLEARPEIKKVEYLSREEALDQFKLRHETDQLLLQAINEIGSNPLRAVLNIKANDPSQYEAIDSFLRGENILSSDSRAIIDKVNFKDNKTAIDKLTGIVRAAERMGMVLAILLAFISIIISFNTIRLAIYISRDEIGVMRLVGASNKYIRGPFVVTGIFYGLSAGLLTIVLFYPITYYLRTATENFFGGVNFFSYYVSHFGELFALIVGVGILLGAISSYLAVRRYLKI